MSTLAIHEIDDERLVVAGGGRRWRVRVERGTSLARAARDAGAALQTVVTGTRPPHVRGERHLASLRALVAVAAERDRRAPGGEAAKAGAALRWAYAGVDYRLTLPHEDALPLARTVTECLLATVSDPREARALATEPLLVTTASASEPRTDAVDSGPSARAGVLERWTGDCWHEHPITPPPLVDPVTGVFHRITQRPPHPDAPPSFVHLHAEVPFLSSIDDRNQPDLLAPAAGFLGAQESPHVSAVLSGVAHVCGADLGQGVRRWASPRSLQAEGARVLTVSDWIPHDPALHDERGFPFVRDEPDLEQWWLLGHDATGPRWVPLSLVHAGYRARDPERSPATNANNLVGLQAGRTGREARDRAAAHLIAQDTVARWWSAPAPLAPASLPALLSSSVDASPWRIRLLSLPGVVPLPVRLAVVDDPENDIIALGYGCATSADEAGLRAVGEALMQHASARDLASSTSLIRDAERLGNGAVAGLAAFDPARGYASGPFADRRQLIDPMCHLQYGLSPEVVARTRDIARASPAAAHGNADEKGARDSERSPFDALLDAEIDVVEVDVTTDRVRAAGAHVVRLLAPTLRRLTVGAFPDRHARAVAPYPGW